MYYWSLAWRIFSITLLVCVMSAIVWSFEHSFALSFFGIEMKTDLFQPLLSFPNCWHIEYSIFTASYFRIWNSSTGIPSPPLALLVVMLPKALDVHVFKAMVFSVVTYRCESWSIRKTEHRRIDAFESQCWRRFLSPLDCKEIRPVNAGLERKINPEYSWEELLLKLKLQYSPPDTKSQVSGKDPGSWKDWRQKEKGETENEMVGRHYQLNGHEF